MPNETTPIVSHSPGPWQVERVTFDPSGRAGFPWRITNRIGTIAPEVWGRVDTERDANARLIAAAPELLDMTRELARVCEGVCHGWPGGDPFGWIEKARALVAKAEGRQP